MHKSYKRTAIPALLATLFFFSVSLATAGPAKDVFLTVYIGYGNSCSGFGICSIVINTSLAEADQPSDRYVTSTATLNGDMLTVNIQKPSGSVFTSLPVREDFYLTSQAANALGYKKVKILRGEYPVDFSDNKLGTISFKIIAESKTTPGDSPSLQSASDK